MAASVLADLEQARWDEGFSIRSPIKFKAFFPGRVGHVSVSAAISWLTDAWKSSWARNSPNGPM